MIISNFSVEPAVFAIDETAKLRFHLQVEPGDSVNGLMVTLTQPYQAVCYWDENWYLAPGQGADLVLEIKVPAGDRIQEHLQANRSLVFTSLDVQLGNFGASAAQDVHFTVLDAWYRPSIARFELERGAGGLPDDEGENLLVHGLLMLSSGADTAKFPLRLHYAENGPASLESPFVDLSDSYPALLAGTDGDAGVVSLTFDKASNWQFLLWMGDEFESVQAVREIPRAFANLHLSGRTTGGACFGGFGTSAEDDPRLESYYPGYFYGGIAQMGASTQSQRALGIQCGMIASGGLPAGGYKDTAVSFPRAFRAGTEPIVVVGFWTGSTSGSFGRNSCAAFSVSNKGFTIRGFNGESTGRSPDYRWIAVGVMD